MSESDSSIVKVEALTDCGDCGEKIASDSARTLCETCDWKRRATSDVEVRLVDLDPGRVRRDAELRAKRSGRGWQRLASPRRDFDRSLLADGCWFCGSAKRLQLDHWDNDRSNNRRSNARTLCKPCHETKTDYYRQDRDQLNTRFRQWADKNVSALGRDGFGSMQEDVYEHTIIETICSKRRYPHRHTYCQEEIDLYQDYCPFCPIMASPLKMLASRNIEEKCSATYSATW